MGRWCPGPLLEQGPFAGLSTSALAAGVRDSYLIDKQPKKTFFTVDIFPVHPDFADSGYPHYWKRKIAGSDIMVDGVEVELYSNGRHIGQTGGWNSGGRAEVMAFPGGGLHNFLVAALHRNKLLEYVHVVTGASYPKLDYTCTFMDTAHTGPEILDRLPDWIETVRQGGNKTQILAFHDEFGFVHNDEFGHFIGCKSLAANVFNILSHGTFDATWVIQIEGFHPNWKQVVQSLPSREQIVELTEGVINPLDWNLCAVLCRDIATQFGASANTRFPCEPGFNQSMFEHLQTMRQS